MTDQTHHKKLKLRKNIEREFLKEVKENPIVEKLEDSAISSVTKIDHIKKLQEILVQTCIDYIQENDLTDIWSVLFSADSLDESSKWGSWQPCTDSYIKVEGLKKERYLRKNGDVFEMPCRYTIGEHM